jgi:hypothetical protein
VHSGIDAEAEDGAVEPRLEHRPDHRLGRGLRMKIERYRQRLDRLEDRREFGMIEILAVDVRVDHHRAHAEPVDGTFDLLRRLLGGVRRTGRHAGEAVGMVAARFGELIVGQDRQRMSLLCRQDLGAGRGQADHLAIDPAHVHVCKAQLTQVLQPIEDEARPFRLAVDIEAHQASKSRIDIRAGKNAAIDVDHLAGRESLFGGNPEITLLAASAERRSSFVLCHCYSWTCSLRNGCRRPVPAPYPRRASPVPARSLRPAGQAGFG